MLAGGHGSRLAPLTSSVNKHLLPLGRKPMICWAVSAMADAGVSEIALVTGPTQIGNFRNVLGDGSSYGLEHLSYIRQSQPKGVADAIRRAERWAGSGSVMVMLGDNVFGQSLRPALDAFTRQAGGALVVLSHPEDPETLHQFGVAQFGDGGRIVGIVEKPSEPPSGYVVSGAYLYDPRLWEILPGLVPSGRGETEITDVNNEYVRVGQLHHVVNWGFWGDAGESIDSYYRCSDFARKCWSGPS